MLVDEAKIGRQEAAEILAVTPDVVTKYIVHGTVTGIRLEAYLRNRDWITSREAVLRFLEAQTEQRLGRVKPTSPGKAKRDRAARLAASNRACEAQGA